VGLQPDRPAQRYSKRHLVPFGEFIPLGFRWFVDLMKLPIGDQQRGAPDQPPMQLAGQRIAVDICFEDLFGDEIISAWHDPAQQPTLLLNLSNLAWFDDSIALPQHLQASRMRALETGRPMLLATNTGVTAIIDPRGRVLAQLPHNSGASLRGQVSGYTGRTPYVRLGNSLPLLLAGALLVAAALGPRGAAARDRTT
jgi:apolipoprotein N-acyltransferase